MMATMWIIYLLNDNKMRWLIYVAIATLIVFAFYHLITK